MSLTRCRKHIKRRHDKRFECAICKHKFGFNKDLTRHMEAVHRDKSMPAAKFPCPVETCDKSYTRNDNLQRHIKTDHGLR
jgi:uncharacterized Zn-finger protein